MALTRELKELVCRNDKYAELHRSPAMRDLERSVCGCAYGSTSWTTRREAELIAQLLELRPAAKLLDVGAGSGWPGLYLSELTGCDVVLADVPLSGLRIAIERAARDGLGERCMGIVANGARLPLQDHCVDAISHSDVLCCLPEKLQTLRECRRVARNGAY